jgi:hypothetical protein
MNLVAVTLTILNLVLSEIMLRIWMSLAAE